MWKNKHVVVAMLVAPILAILAWFAVDQMVAERAHKAKAGAGYKLVAKSDCRYESGKCTLQNNEFKLVLKPVETAPGVTSFSIESVFGLANVTMSLVVSGEEVVASAVPADSEQPGTHWTITIPAAATPDAQLRVAATAQQSLYFAEAPLTFTLEPDRRFSR